MRKGTHVLKGSPETVAEHHQLGATRLLFVGLCAYIISQVFLIPVLPIGPWALWPNLSDFVTILLAVVWFTQSTFANSASKRMHSIPLMPVAVIFLAMVSYVGMTILVSGFFVIEESFLTGVSFGAFTIYRLLQFTLLFLVARRTVMNRSRLNVLHHLLFVTLTITVILCVATYLGVITTSRLGFWLPTELGVAGPWGFYAGNNLQGQGVGAVGYNLGYSALQILLLLGLTLQTSSADSALGNLFAIVASAVGIFVTGSGAGLIGFVVFLFLFFWFTNPLKKVAIVLGGILVTMAVSVYTTVNGVDPELASSLSRAQSDLNPSDYRGESLNGRLEIWSRAMGLIGDNPFRLIFGYGVGMASAVLGAAAHSNALHLLLEMGVLGLAAWSVCIFTVILSLWNKLPHTGPIVATTLALLMTTMTQETFYPVPAFGHFIGFYIVGVSVVFNSLNQQGSDGNGSAPPEMFDRIKPSPMVSDHR